MSGYKFILVWVGAVAGSAVLVLVGIYVKRPSTAFFPYPGSVGHTFALARAIWRATFPFSVGVPILVGLALAATAYWLVIAE